MKILHYGLSSHLGGIETYLYNLVRFIDRKKYQNDFIIIGKEIPCFYNELKSFGCEFFFIPSRRESVKGNKKELEKILVSEKFDIIHCHCNTLSFIDPILIGLKTNTKVIVHSRNAGAKVPFASFVLDKVNKQRINNKNLELVAVSTEAGKWMFGNKSFTVINNGVDTEKYRFNLIKRNEIRNELNLVDRKVIILTGAFRKQKNHCFAIEVMHQLLKKSEKYFLILLGDGNLKDDVEQYARKKSIEKNVLFLGNKKNVSDYLSAADYFLFPSFYEGFPNALLEAETNGLKCFVSSTITKEVKIDKLVTYIDLAKGAPTWAEIIDNSNEYIDRVVAYELVEKLKKDKKSEIKKITDLYENIV